MVGWSVQGLDISTFDMGYQGGTTGNQDGYGCHHSTDSHAADSAGVWEEALLRPDMG